VQRHINSGGAHKNGGSHGQHVTNAHGESPVRCAGADRILSQRELNLPP